MESLPAKKPFRHRGIFFVGGLHAMAYLLPLLIFVAEVCVVTICTIRIIVLSRGLKVLAAALGSIEITIWLFAIGQIMRNLSDPFCYLAFAAGFTLGNYLGVVIEERLALGTIMVRLITPRNPAMLIERLRQGEYGVTSLPAAGVNGPVNVVLTVVPRKELKTVTNLLHAFDPHAFYSVDDLHAATHGIFPSARLRGRPQTLEHFRACCSSEREALAP
jgi:uncharacterized protein YebE (UPF0316 family)